MSRYLKNGFNDIVDIVLGSDDDESIVEKVGDLYLELYGEESVVLGLVEKVRLLKVENINLNERIHLIETKLERLENWYEDWR